MASRPNRIITLEIGPGHYFPIVGMPVIDDPLESHGATCRTATKLKDNQTFPLLGSYVAIVRNNKKEFGGRYLHEAISRDGEKNVFDFQFDNYVAFTRIKSFRHEARNLSLTGHCQLAFLASGAGENGLLDLDVIGDDGEPFDYAWPETAGDASTGKLEQFLNDICKRRKPGFIWKIYDSGSLTLESFSNHRGTLKVISLESSNLQAPVGTVYSPDSERACPDKFYFNHRGGRGIPSYSVIEVYGRNGRNKPKDVISEDDLTRPSVDELVSDGETIHYPVSKTSDLLISVEIEIP